MDRETLQSGWVSAKEELPKDKVLVIAYSKLDPLPLKTAYFSSDRFTSGWWELQPCGCKKWLDDNEITHWMPLPDPPKELDRREQNE